MSHYRWYLIHELIWSLFFDSMGSLIGAVTLFPLPCYFGVNAANHFTGSYQIVYFFVGVNSLVGKSLALIIQFQYRFQRTLPPDSFLRVLDLSRFPLHLHLIITVCIMCVVSGVLFVSV